MSFLETIKLSFLNLKINKFRSFLTMLGIIMGIMSVVLISSLGTGYRNKMITNLEKSLSKMIVVSLNSAQLDKKLGSNIYLTKSDFENFKNIKHVKNYHIILQQGGYNVEERKYSAIEAINHEMMKAQGNRIVKGRMFTKEELEDKGSPFGIISEKENQKKYGGNAVGQTIELKIGDTKRKIVIIGTWDGPSAEITSIADSTIIYVPYSVLYDPHQEYYTNVLVEMEDVNYLDQIMSEIRAYLIKNKTTRDIYSISTVSQDFQQINTVIGYLQSFIILVASISLLVGGIGVMNIMLVSVTERITEIGLRKAIGAKNKDIKNQFLIESSVLTFVGGFIGFALGYIIAWLIGLAIDVVPSLTPKILIASILVSIGTGLLFGIYPAKIASKLSPMEALRKE